MDVDADVDADGDAEGGALAFLSLRFWVFFASFFGLTGVLLSALGLGPLATGIAATVLGLFAGSVVTRTVRRLKAREPDSSVGELDLVGERGAVLLPIGPGRIGKIRVALKGRDVELLARLVGDRAVDLPIGTRVRIRSMDADGAAEVLPV